VFKLVLHFIRAESWKYRSVIISYWRAYRDSERNLLVNYNGGSEPKIASHPVLGSYPLGLQSGLSKRDRQYNIIWTTWHWCCWYLCKNCILSYLPPWCLLPWQVPCQSPWWCSICGLLSILCTVEILFW